MFKKLVISAEAEIQNNKIINSRDEKYNGNAKYDDAKHYDDVYVYAHEMLLPKPDVT